MTDFLYIAHFFPPISNVEAKINYTTINLFKKNGFNPIIISSNYEKYPLDIIDFKDELLIHRYNFSDGNKYLNYLRNKLQIPDSPINFSQYRNIIKIAEKIIRKNDIKFIYSVFGKGIEHIAATKLKNKYNIPLVLEFQDPWTNNKIMQKYIDEKSVKFYGRFLRNRINQKEKEVITSADMILVESPLHKQYLIKKYGLENIYVHLLGFNKHFIEKIIDDEIIELPHKPVIGFIGTTYYGFYEICLNFMLALKRLENEGIRFTFISTGETYFNKLEGKINLKNHIPIIRVGYKKALKFMNSLDMGLVLTLPNYKENINSKMFEYLALKKHIIAIAPEDGDMARIIRENNLGIIIGYSEDDMYNELKKFIKKYNEGLLNIDENVIDSFNRERIFEPIVTMIKEMIK